VSSTCPRISATFLSFLVVPIWLREGSAEAPSKYSHLARTRMRSSILRTCYSLPCNHAPISCTAVSTPVPSWQIVLLAHLSGRIRKSECMSFRCNIFRWTRMPLALGRDFASSLKTALPSNIYGNIANKDQKATSRCLGRIGVHEGPACSIIKSYISG